MMHLKIAGMTCDSCAAHVKEALEKVPGVQSAEVSYAQGAAQLAVAAGTALDTLVAAVSKTDVSFDKREAVVTFDDAKTNVETLIRATQNAGYPTTEIR